MIRKTILALIVLYVLVWIGIAHLAKSSIVSLVNNSQTDNIKISYKDVSVAGFPFSWKVRFAAPKITVIDQTASWELSSDYLNCIFNYRLTRANLELGKNLYYSTQGTESIVNYKLASQENIEASIDFFSSIYKVDTASSLSKEARNIKFANPAITAFAATGKEVFCLAGIDLTLLREAGIDTDRVSLKAAGNYKSFLLARRVNNADLYLEASYIINNNHTGGYDPGFDHKIEIAGAKISVDDASCEVKGFLNLDRGRPPQGKMAVEMVHYDDFVDILVPNDFIFSKPYLKQFISKAAAVEFSNEPGGRINFDVEFSDKGIIFGRINLLDLRNN